MDDTPETVSQPKESQKDDAQVDAPENASMSKSTSEHASSSEHTSSKTKEANSKTKNSKTKEAEQSAKTEQAKPAVAANTPTRAYAPDNIQQDTQQEDALLALPRATAPREVPAEAPLDEPTLYFNRELGDVDFNWRVLYQAIDERTPLLERVRFISITASNLDEFFQKRVGGLLRQQAAGVVSRSPDGRGPSEQLALIRSATRALYDRLNAVWQDTLRHKLADAGFTVSDYHDLTPDQHDELADYFHQQIYPILTPLAVDPGRPFPFISNLSLSLAVTLAPNSKRSRRQGTSFVRLKVPVSRGRWVSVGKNQVVPLEQVIAYHAHELFPGMRVSGVYAFRVTRNADVRRDEEEADDLLAVISEELRERRFAPVVRLEIDAEMPAGLRSYLARHLELDPADIFESPTLLDLTDCEAFADLPQFDENTEYHYDDWQSLTPKQFTQKSSSGDKRTVFDIIRENDVLVHHPYDTFGTTVQRLLEEASVDPNVIAIKQTLYRTSNDSPIVAALIRAAERGKQVAALVEVKARFDEANNIEWGERLEDSGVHVAYGLVGLKIHTKVMLIVRQEKDGIRTYCHIGTGNYNSKTARLYTDLGMFTCREDIGHDIVNLFHHITGYAPEQQYQQLLVAPRDMRRHFIELIEREISIQKDHNCGRIIAKMNGLDDLPIIQKLYQASQAGVQVDLIVRGHSRLRPGLPGYSDNIRVRSIIGRFLEHDRSFYFGNGSCAFEKHQGQAEKGSIPYNRPDIFIGSADWKRRNMADRIEAITPVVAPELQERIIGVLALALADNRLAWQLYADGHYAQLHPKDGEASIALHDALMKQAQEKYS